MNLSDMTIEDLDKLQKEIALAKIHNERRRIENAKTEITKLMDKLGVTPDEVFGDLVRKRVKGSALPDKYVSPDDPDLRWSGHGRKPKWFNEAIARGVKREDMAI